MLKEILTAAIKGLAQQLAINPRNLRVVVVLDDDERLLARVDATTVRELLNEPAARRVLRFKLGNIAYDVDLGGTAGRRAKRITKVRQRGFSDER